MRRRWNHYRQILAEVAEQTSEMERRADEAERETVKLKKAEYMENEIWREFEGVISGVTSWGMYVELPNTMEGLVHVAHMRDDYYQFDEERYGWWVKRPEKYISLVRKYGNSVLDADR